MLISQTAKESLVVNGYCVAELVSAEANIGDKEKAMVGLADEFIEAIVVSVHRSEISPFVKLAVLQIIDEKKDRQ